MTDAETFRSLALALPDAKEEPHFEAASFRINKKIFATLHEKKKLACLMLSEVDQSVFSAFDPAIVYPVPNKWGRQGATYVELELIPEELLKDALNQAYQHKLSKK